MRIVSICPSNTEIVAYLGLTDLLVGVDDYSDWPTAVQHLPKVGPDLQIDMDKVEELNPDLVIASLSVPGMEKNIEALDQRNIPYIVLNPNSLKEIAEDIQTVARILNHEARGVEKAKQFLQEINDMINEYASRTEKPKLYWEWWPKPIFTPGGKNWLTEMSAIVGAENIFATENVASYQTDWEEVKERNPDHICMVWVGVKEEKMRPELVKKRPGWDEMIAIKNDNIHVLQESLYCRPSPRLLEGLKKLIPIVHN